jgi:hypothetical protein
MAIMLILAEKKENKKSMGRTKSMGSRKQDESGVDSVHRKIRGDPPGERRKSNTVKLL